MWENWKKLRENEQVEGSVPLAPFVWSFPLYGNLREIPFSMFTIKNQFKNPCNISIIYTWLGKLEYWSFE